MESKELLDLVVKEASDVKAVNPVIIDFEGQSSVADYLLICNGRSSAHAKGIAEEIELNVKKATGIYANGIEGEQEGEWILMDYIDVIIHIFVEEKRNEYKLEELYSEYKKIEIED